MRHPDSPGTVETDAERAPMYESQGWVRVPEPKPAKPAKRAAAQPKAAKKAARPAK